jgi:hypothetical protein
MHFSKPVTFVTTLHALMAVGMALPSGFLTPRGASLIQRNAYMAQRNARLMQRDDGNSTDPPDTSICDYTFNSVEESQTLWDETGAGQWLDDFISKFGEANWVRHPEL